MSPITIDHHKTAFAHCQDCASAWATSDTMLVSAVLSGAAEHAVTTGHTVAEHVQDDAVVHQVGR